MTSRQTLWYLLAFVGAIAAGIHVAEKNYGWATFVALLALIAGMQAARKDAQR